MNRPWQQVVDKRVMTVKIGDKPRLETTQSEHPTADNCEEKGWRAWAITQQVKVFGLSLET